MSNHFNPQSHNEGRVLKSTIVRNPGDIRVGRATFGAGKRANRKGQNLGVTALSTSANNGDWCGRIWLKSSR